MSATPLPIRLDGDGPLYRQLDRALRGAILGGRLGEGSRLPASRELAQSLGLSRNVVLAAYSQLTAEGYLEGSAGRGTFVASPLPESLLNAAPSGDRGDDREPAGPPQVSDFALAAQSLRQREGIGLGPRQPFHHDFSYGEVAPDERCREEWRRLLGRAMRRASTDYSPPEGLPALREAIADYLRRVRGCRCSADQIIVVNGSQQALDLIARALLHSGDRVAIENPSYRGARHAFSAAGHRLCPIAVDADGIDVAALEALKQPPRLCYTTPSHQFPTGAVLSLPRRLALLDWARRHHAWLLEDDYDSEFRYDGPPLQAMQGLDDGGRVLYVGTFSRALFPALRLGYLLLPEALVEPLRAVRWLVDRHSPTLSQQVLAQFIAEGCLDRQLRRMRKRYGERRKRLVAALREQFGERLQVRGSNAGIHLLAGFADLSAGELESRAERARAAGVGVYSTRQMHLGDDPDPGLMLGYARLPEERIDAAVAALFRCL